MTPHDPVELWNDEATTFDEAPDHGLRDPGVRAAWRDLLCSVLPPATVVPEEGGQRPSRRARVVDLGCGTGTLSLLLADEGYDVTGVDFSPEMLTRAEAKAGDRVRFVAGDAGEPPLPRSTYDVVLCRHVLWALADQPAVLRRWIDLLVPGGRLVLVEGNWSNGAGLTAARTIELLEGAGREAEVRMLPEAEYWGGEIDDERYLVVSPR